MTMNTRSFIPALPRGYARPRIETPTAPTSDLKNVWRLGYQIIQWIEEHLDIKLQSWQRYTILRAHELRADGSLAYRRVVCQVGRQAGKSTLISALAAFWLAHDTNVIYSSASIDVAREQLMFTVDHVTGNTEIFGRVRTRQANGQYSIEVPKLKTKYSIASQNRKAGRGRTAGRVVVDEVRELTDQLALDALQSTALAVDGSQLWYVSNAGDVRSVPLNRMTAQGRAGESELTLYLEYSAPDDAALDDPAMWRFHPAFGRTISAENVRMLLESSIPASFRTEFFCSAVTNLRSIVNDGAWDACYDPIALDAHRARVVVGFDGDEQGRCVLVAAVALPDKRVRIETVAAWETWQLARADLPALLKQVRPRSFGWIPAGPASAIATVLKELPRSVELSGVAVTSAAAGYVDLIQAGQLAHNGDELLGSGILQAAKLKQGDAYRFNRQTPNVHAAYAAAIAAHLARQVPAKSGFRLISPNADVSTSDQSLVEAA